MKTPITTSGDFFPVAYYGPTTLNEAWTKKPHETPVQTLSDIDAYLPQT